jgi:hypothetical protein
MPKRNPKWQLAKLTQAVSWLIIVLTVAGLTSFLIRAIYYEAVISLATLIIFVYLQFFLNRRRWLHNPPVMQLFISIIVFFSVTFGRFFFFYTNLPGYDKAIHLLYGIAFCVVGYALFYRINPAQRQNLTVNQATIFLFAVCFAIACSFFWEIYEFLGDRLLGTNMQRWQQGLTSGITDTMLDMLADLVGINLAGIIWYRESKRDPGVFYQRRIAMFLDFDALGRRMDEKGKTTRKSRDSHG